MAARRIPMFRVTAAKSRARWVTSHVAVQDSTTVVADDEEAIENAECQRRYGEEVHRGNRLAMISEEMSASASWDRAFSAPAEPIATPLVPKDRSRA